MKLIRRLDSGRGQGNWSIHHVDPDEVAQYQGCIHGIEDLIAVFREHGWPAWIPPIQVYPSPLTGEPYTLLDGHHRLEAALAANLPLIPAVVVDSTVAEALVKAHDWFDAEEKMLDLVHNVGWEHARDWPEPLK